ncbi:hypothetical protein QOZ80_9BG0712580 [Eleusine coracana subsp. coracana]|nr:hypothetical protein QOZ80_9BG0712580 [Eleusine coracana subsp. coracana]
MWSQSLYISSSLSPASVRSPSPLPAFFFLRKLTDMAVQAQFGGFAECLPPYYYGGGITFAADSQARALDCFDDYDGALLSAAAANNDDGFHYCPDVVILSAAQSELTCNGSAAATVLPPSSSSRKRGREAAGCFDALLMQKASRVVDSAAASTSGRVALPSAQDSLVLSELWRQQGAEIDALVRAECDRVRAGLELLARKRQRHQELARAVERRVREVEAELGAARRRNAELEARVAQAVDESMAWQGVARGHEAAAAELRAALEHFLLRGGAAAGVDAVEGFGESGGGEVCPPAGDAESCCFVEANKDVDDVATATSSPATKWACKACGVGEATVMLLPCRHLCLCKSCEPRTDACPACLAVKNASVHVAPN